MVKKVGQLCFSGRTCCFFDDIYLKSCKPFRAALMPSGVLQPKCLVVSAGNKDNGIWMLDATTGAASPCSKWERGLQGASPGQAEEQTPDLGRNAQDLSYFSPWFVSSWKGKKKPQTPHKTVAWRRCDFKAKFENISDLQMASQHFHENKMLLWCRG